MAAYAAAPSWNRGKSAPGPAATASDSAAEAPRALAAQHLAARNVRRSGCSGDLYSFSFGKACPAPYATALAPYRCQAATSPAAPAPMTAAGICGEVAVAVAVAAPQSLWSLPAPY